MHDPPPAPHIPLWDSERYLSSLSTIATYLGASCRTPFQPAPYNLMGWVEMQPLPAPPSPIQDSQSCAATPAPYRILGWGELHPLNFPPPPLPHRTQGAAAPLHPSCTIQPLWHSGSCSPPIQHHTTLWGLGPAGPLSSTMHPSWGVGRWMLSLSTVPTYWGAGSCASPSGPINPYRVWGSTCPPEPCGVRDPDPPSLPHPI